MTAQWLLSVYVPEVSRKHADVQRAMQIMVAQWTLESGNLTLAKKCAQQADSVSKSSIESRLLLALVARYEKDFPDAKKLLESVHLESLANLAAIIELALVLTNMDGKENQGIQYAQLATKLQPDLRTDAGRNAAMTLAWILHKYGGQLESASILQQVLLGGQLSVESSCYAAKILLAGENRAAAQKLLKETLDTGLVFPGHDEAKLLYEQTKW